MSMNMYDSTIGQMYSVDSVPNTMNTYTKLLACSSKKQVFVPMCVCVKQTSTTILLSWSFNVYKYIELEAASE